MTTLHPDPFASFLRSEHTLPEEPGVRQSWHAERTDYAVWVVRVDAPAVLARAQDAQATLCNFIAPQPLSQLHVTVWVAGFVANAHTPANHANDSRHRDDDISHEVLERQALALRTSTRAGRLQLGGVSSFRTVPFLAVDDADGCLAHARQLLDGTAREPRFTPYVPHLTLGRYTHATPVQEIAAVLAPLRVLPPITIEPAAIELVTYDARTPDSPLHTRVSIPLRTGCA